MLRCTNIAQLGTRLDAMKASRSCDARFGTDTTDTNAVAAGYTGMPLATAVKKWIGPHIG